MECKLPVGSGDAAFSLHVQAQPQMISLSVFSVTSDFVKFLSLNAQEPAIASKARASGPKTFMEICDRLVSSAIQAAKRQEAGGYPCYRCAADQIVPRAVR
jgi:hypothetical protein